MTSVVLRVALLLGAVWLVYVVISRVKRSKIQIEDSVFWVVLAFVILLNAIFPQIAYFFSGLLGIASPSNFVFLLISAILLLKEFSTSMQLSVLRHKVDQLAQVIALSEKEKRDREDLEPGEGEGQGQKR